MSTPEAMNKLTSLAYPRTGKRGVPQQFPRRLYEMLESETKLHAENQDSYVISWSASGKAFHIVDVGSFATTILPKYFRTKKFSSFQRNLNLYGFAKVRRGPDTDMYAHPSFLRGQPELLAMLRKSTTTARRRSVSKGSSSDDSSTGSTAETHIIPVSPSQPRLSPIQLAPASMQHSLYPTPSWLTFTKQSMPAPVQPDSPPPSRNRAAGRLDLLALAIEHEACLV